MTSCVDLLRWLEEGQGQIPAHLEAHAAACPHCQTLVAAWPELTLAGSTVRDLKAPPPLVSKLSRMARLPRPCEEAFMAMSGVLDQEAEATQRQKLVQHLGQCSSCRATWEALATLKQTGEATRAPAGVVRAAAALALPQVVRARGSRWRLAAAAAYILAGSVVLATGSGEFIGREAQEKLTTAFLYGRAAVANRLRWAAKELETWFSQSHQLAKDSLSRAFAFWRQTLGVPEENQKAAPTVQSPEEGGPS
ncbi:MAG: hypothetical protein NZ869_03955 [Thermoanaerobaculum sp.]|nr:hypothetical protein [Thermoanaerobaculum sp.]MCX7896196.1 hypothetical protein [Thermoanaerobaculum sp.]MDW7968175.1 hypothetical protein [Thermoanaerobaculum sp.]